MTISPPPAEALVYTALNNLKGTWMFREINQEGEIGILHFTDFHRAIQFIYDPLHPEQRRQMLLWFYVISPTQLRFSIRPNDRGWLRGYEFTKAGFTLIADEYRYECTRPLPTEIPDWFVSALALELK